MLNIQSNISLLPYNTFQIDVQAKYFVEITTLEELQELFTTEVFQQEKRLILGGGANVLFTGDVEGLVIKVGLKGMSEGQGVINTKEVIHIKVAAGENWSDFVEYANEQGRAGIENLIAIPGQVGTAPISNIWAYGVEVGNRVAGVEGYDLETGEFKKFSQAECEFAYRSSIFKFALRNKFLITHVVFALELFDGEYVFNLNYPDVQKVLFAAEPRSASLLPPSKGGLSLTLQKVSQIIAEIRAKKLPDHTKIGTAGSFFANPLVDIQHFEILRKEYPEMPFWEVTPSPFGDSPWQGSKMKLSAGRLIEKAGLKGYSNGKAGTSPNHALILINEWGSASDVLEVVAHIQTVVKERFNVDLQPEVVYV